ncbi:unnamed protein product, partial [Prorocentrum cordatum]
GPGAARAAAAAPRPEARPAVYTALQGRAFAARPLQGRKADDPREENAPGARSGRGGAGRLRHAGGVPGDRRRVPREAAAAAEPAAADLRAGRPERRRRGLREVLRPPGGLPRQDLPVRHLRQRSGSDLSCQRGRLEEARQILDTSPSCYTLGPPTGCRPSCSTPTCPLGAASRCWPRRTRTSRRPRPASTSVTGSATATCTPATTPGPPWLLCSTPPPRTRAATPRSRAILHALRSGTPRCDDGLGGLAGRLPPLAQAYRSTEHNIDVAALAAALGEEEVWQDAHGFVRSMHGRNRAFPRAYSMGTGGDGDCDSSQPEGVPVPADCTYWNLLADADPDVEFRCC